MSVALYTGLLQGELLGLRWSDVDRAEGRLQVVRALQRGSRAEGRVAVLAELKTSKSRRTFPLPAPAREQLAAHRVRQREAQLLLGPAWAAGGIADLMFTNPRGDALTGFT